MKKVLIMLLALVMVFSFVACKTAEAAVEEPAGAQVASWEEFKAAVDAKSELIVLTADIAWDNAVVELDLTGITVDLNGQAFTGLGKATTINGVNFTIMNGSIAGAEGYGVLAIGEAAGSDEVKLDTDVSATDAANPIILKGLAITNATVELGIKYVQVENVTITGFDVNGLYFNGASGIIDGVAVSGGANAEAIAVNVAGPVNVEIKGENSFAGAYVGLRLYKYPTVVVSAGTTSLSAARSDANVENALRMADCAYFTVKSGATVNLTTDANQNQGAIGLANARKGDRSAKIVVESGATMNFIRASKGSKNGLFWASNVDGRYVIAFEKGSIVTDKIGDAAPAKATIASVDAMSAATCDGFIRCPKGSMANVLTSGEIAEPAEGSKAYSFFDFRD